MLELDHVLLAVTDLAAAGKEIESRYGLASVEGGRHPAWGTANRIVPLGETYLELIAVVDPEIAAGDPVGRWVTSGESASPRPLGWAVRTTHLDEIARRLDLPMHAGSRATPGGEILRWRHAGLDRAIAEPPLPFFIQWDPQTKLPGRSAMRHPAGDARISRLDIAGDPGRMGRWLGEHQLPIVVVSGKAAITAVHLSTDAGEVVLGG